MMPRVPSVRVAGREVDYTLVRHPRARRVRLTLTPDGLRVSAPPRMSARAVGDAVQTKEAWLTRHQHLLAPPAPPVLTDGDLLPLLGGVVELGVREAARGAVRFAAEDGRLAVAAPHPERVGALVERWYRRVAAERLGGLAAGHAAGMGVAYTRLTVRDPRSRWGSCSTTGALSLSWRLVMAPARVAEYVVVHEVAHLAEMNHSPAFWRLVAGRWPGYADDVEWLRRHGWWLHRGPFPVAGATAT
jgi:hypothetical protein